MPACGGREPDREIAGLSEERSVGRLAAQGVQGKTPSPWVHLIYKSKNY